MPVNGIRVYCDMHVEDESRNALVIFTLGANGDEHTRKRNPVLDFEACTCECCNESLRSRLMQN